MELHIPFRSQHRLPCASLSDMTFSFSLPVLFGAKRGFAQANTCTLRFKLIHKMALLSCASLAIFHQET